MSERIAPTYTREEFTDAVKRARWAHCGQCCEGCGRSLLPAVPHVFDHHWPNRLGGPATFDNCRVLCNDGPGSCNYRKTHGLDLPGIAAAKRYAKNRLPLDIGRPEKKPGKIPQRPNATWPKQSFPNRRGK